MTRRQTNHGPSFDDQLVLFRYFLHELKLDSLSALSEKLNSSEYEGVNESGNTYFYIYIARVCQMRGATITPEKLRLYDENICRHTRKIGEKRGGLQWKYYQYIALLFTEMYLDRYFSDADAFCNDLNAWLRQVKGQSLGLIDFQLYTPDKLNKLAFMCATGSGKTLIMHINILQFLHYFKRAKRINSRLSINKIIVLAPNENMSRQHLDELSRSSIPAAMFEKDHGFVKQQDDVIVIDMNKLKEEGKVKVASGVHNCNIIKNTSRCFQRISPKFDFNNAFAGRFQIARIHGIHSCVNITGSAYCTLMVQRNNQISNQDVRNH